MGTISFLLNAMHVFNFNKIRTITYASEKSQGGQVFVIIFAIVWIGGLIITLNTRFLGANM